MNPRRASGQPERLTFNWGASAGGRVPRAADTQTYGREAPAAPIPAETGNGSTRAAVRREPRDWAFTWMLLFTAALFLRPQDLIPPLQILHLPEVTAIAGLASLFSSRLRRRQPLTRMTPDLMGVILLGAIILLTAPFSVWPGGSVRLFIETYSKVILIYLLAVNVISSPRRLERFTWILVLAVSYVALLAVLDYVRGTNMIGHGTRVRGAVGGVLGNPNDLALNMVSFLPLAAFIAMRSGSIARRIVAAGCVLLMVVTIVATQSRGGFLGFIAMMVVLGAFAVRRRPAFVVVGALAALCALPIVPGDYWLRLASITNENLDPNGSEAARRELMKESFRAFVENPVTGVGAGQFVNWDPQRDQASHEAHDVLLQVASELGITGLAVFVFLIGRAFLAVYQTRRLVREAKRRRDPSGPDSPIDEHSLQLLDAHSAAMAAALTGWTVCALFGSVAYSWTFYYLLLLAATPREMLRDALPHRTRAARRVPPALEVARA
ncbi:MAG: O-antigen ligase family protein [Vicinamibacterales bacterium]